MTMPSDHQPPPPEHRPPNTDHPPPAPGPSLVDRVIRFCLEQKLVVALIVLFVVAWGIMVAPFDWQIGGIQRRPVPVDAIPDIGENQQIVFAEWAGRSPKDVDDQITYPLTAALRGIPDVKTVRSMSLFGFSMIYVIFEERVGFETAQNRIVARLSGLPSGMLPQGVNPRLGPYATALGQIYWYTLEGRDPDGNAAGGWDPHELRTIQDWVVRYHLQSAGGITEVASIGGFLQEYQIDVSPDKMRQKGVTLGEVAEAVRMSNLDVGARQIEVNRVEYLIRAKGFIHSISDIENTVVKVNGNVPLYVRDVGTVSLGPAMREGALDKEGAEAVGGVAIVSYGYNPLQAIKNVQRKIEEIAPSLDVKVVADWHRTSKAALTELAARNGFEAFQGATLNQAAWKKFLDATPRAQWPAGVTTSRATIVPFYDRTALIYETLGTLNSALYEQVLITTIVVIVMTFNLRMSILVSAVMPLAVLFSFIAMKLLGVEANIVSLSGIAIAIGTIVDMGVVICQNILQHLEAAPPEENRLEVIYRAASEVGGAVLTAISTTVVGFLPVFFMTGPEGKLFRPLAFTKTFCLIGSVIVALTVIPAAAHVLLTGKIRTKALKGIASTGLVGAGVILGLWLGWWWAGLVLVLLGGYLLVADSLPAPVRKVVPWVANAAADVIVDVLLTQHWLPLGPQKGLGRNLTLVAILIGGLQVFYYLVERFYGRILGWFLRHKLVFMAIPLLIVLTGYTAWLGFETVFGVVPAAAKMARTEPEVIRKTTFWLGAARKFPGFGKEFMPPLDEGSFLFMPTTMPHASIGEVLDVIKKQDRAVRAIPEVESVVGKLGRADTALDPAPVNMIETVINYKSEYITDKDGRYILYEHDEGRDDFVRDESGELKPDPKHGRPYRQWRGHIRSPDDIWQEIIKATEIPGTTSAPKLQPIAARIVMLQSGMRAPMGIKVIGQEDDLDKVEQAGFEIERLLKSGEVPGVDPSTVVADRIVGKPYLEIEIDRVALARYGLRVEDVQAVIEVAIGGVPLTTTVEGRKRFPVRVRYERELRDEIETLGKIAVPAMSGAQVPLSQLTNLSRIDEVYRRGPESLKREDSFLVSYVLFDKQPGHAEVDVVEAADRYLKEHFTKPSGIAYKFAGTYENELHASATLAYVLPLTLFIIFMLIYFQFRSVTVTTLIFSTIFVCWGGGLVMIWLYGQPWFLDFSLFGVNFRDLFQVHTVNMSIAIWVGFLALFGIASDDAVVICTYLDQRFAQMKPATVDEVREATIYAGKRRIRACLMTTATTVLALLPVLTSTGRGSDIMVPMSLPSFGGMIFQVITMFMAPVLYCLVKELRLRRSEAGPET